MAEPTKPVAPVTKTRITISPFLHFTTMANFLFLSSNPTSKRLSNHFFTLLPKSFGVGWVHRVGSHSFADHGNRCVVWDYAASVAVLAVTAADLIRRSNDAGPHGSRSALRDRFPLEGPFPLCRELLIDLRDELLNASRVRVAPKLGLYAARMHGCSANATPAVPFVERNRKKNIRCLRAAVRNERLVRRPLKTGILQINVGVTVARRR